MQIGMLRVSLLIHDAQSLKDKRRIIKSLKDQLRYKFNLAVAEVADQDIWQRAVLGIATVANDGKYIESYLAQIVNFIQKFSPVRLIDYEQEIF